MTWLAVPLAGFAIYVGIMAAASYRASRRRVPTCLTCGRASSVCAGGYSCPRFRYRGTPPGAGAL